jgi:CBS domain-containing protein
MPAQVADLIRDKALPIRTRREESIAQVLSLMIEHDYSQLPVVDEANKPVGLVTSDSILRALHHFGVTTDKLFVRDAMVKKPSEYYAEDDIFDLLDDLEQGDAVHIVDIKGILIGIVTTYDTTAYLRQRSQDIMYVRDVEEMVKSYTNQAFLDTTGNIDIQKQKDAITEITPSNNHLRGKFSQAVKKYLGQCGHQDQLNNTVLKDAFDTHLFERQTPKAFDRLTLNEYIELLTHQSRWSTYSEVFSLDRDAVRRLLMAVRQTRNDLAHFRDDISAQQRQELIFAKEWLARYESAIVKAFAPSTPTLTTDVVVMADPPLNNPSEAGATTNSSSTSNNEPSVESTSDEFEDEIAPIDEILDNIEGRYAPLTQHLQRQRRNIERITLSFKEIDELLGEYGLPDSARRYRTWWANDSVSHSQSQQWLNAGWRVAGINMSDERVTFARHKERERLYIDFFSALLKELRSSPQGENYLQVSPHGQSWIGVASIIYQGHRVASFNFSFTQTRRFRVELYIDTGEQAANKQVFDALLSQREAIEAEFEGELSWERIDDRRGSRIARYYPGTITDSAGSLQTLRTRVVLAMNRLRRVLTPRIETVLPKILSEEVLKHNTHDSD